MNRSMLYNLEGFLYGEICSSEPDQMQNFKKTRSNIDVPLEEDKILSVSASSEFPIVDKIPAQTAGVSEVLERNLNWGEVLPEIRRMWGSSQFQMSKILGISEKTILNIEKNNSKPNTINRKKLFLIKNVSDFLLKRISRKYAISNLIDAKLPALGMLSPKEYLEGGEESSFRELMGVLKRMYK